MIRASCWRPPDRPRFQLLGKLRQKAYHEARAGWLGNDPGVLALAEEHFRDFTPEVADGAAQHRLHVE